MTRYTPGQATSIVPLIDEAFALHCAGRLDEAEALYCEALHMDPGHRGVRKNLAQVLIRDPSFGV